MASSTLTHAQVLGIRSDTGDETRPPLLGFVEIQTLFDRAGGDVDVTIVYCLRRILAKRSKLIAGDSKIFDKLRICCHTGKQPPAWIWGHYLQVVSP